MSRRGSSTGNGAGWPTRVADSVGMSQTSMVASTNSSMAMVPSWGRPRSVRSSGRGPGRTGLCRPRGSVRRRPAAPGCPVAGTCPRRTIRRRRGSSARRSPLAGDSRAVLEEVDDVAGERPVGLAAQVGHVHRDPPAGLQLLEALAEHVVQHAEVGDVGRRGRSLPRAPPRTPCRRSRAARSPPAPPSCRPPGPTGPCRGRRRPRWHQWWQVSRTVLSSETRGGVNRA